MSIKNQNNLDSKIQGKPDDKKEFRIIVNGQEKISPKRELGYEDIVQLAFDNPVFDKPDIIIYTITYKQPRSDKQGSIVKGETVKIEAGMIFNVTKTDKS